MHTSQELDKILQIIGSKYQTEFESLEIDGQTLQTLNVTNMPDILNGLVARNAIRNPLQDLPLWAKIWPAAMILGRFLRKFDTTGKTMLELGAGIGICSLLASRHGFGQITATDNNADALNFIKANILVNNLSHLVSAAYLDVNDPKNRTRFNTKFDYICASELLYLDHLHKPILKFIDHNLEDNGKALFCSDYKRIKPHFKKLAAKNYKISDGAVALKAVDSTKRQIFNILILEKQ